MVAADGSLGIRSGCVDPSCNQLFKLLVHPTVECFERRQILLDLICGVLFVRRGAR